MNFFNAISKAVFDSFNIKGRSSRSEFWYFTLFIILLDIILLPIEFLTYGFSSFDEYWNSDEISLFYNLVTIISLIPSTSVTIRRLHDIDKSGWWLLLSITIIGLIPIIYWCAKKGNKEENKYGKVPIFVDDTEDADFSLTKSEYSLEEELDKIEKMYKAKKITLKEKQKMRAKILNIE